MTGLIIVDESGDLGSGGSRYFTMTALVVSAPRDLYRAAKMIPPATPEHKFYNSSPEERTAILRELSYTSVSIAYVVIEKNNPASKKFCYGNELYRNMLRNLLDVAMGQIMSVKDVNVIIDGSRFITNDELRTMGKELAAKHELNLRKCRKGISSHEPCLRVVDFAAESFHAEYEDDDKTYSEILSEKISIARRY